MNKIIPYGRHHITEADIDAVVETLKSDYLTQGPKIAEFEHAFAKYAGAKYAVAVSNGTAALHLCCLALDVGPDSKVITTPITFAASANCVTYCGGEVAFADIDPGTALLSIQKVRQMLEASTKGTYRGIIPVDFAGYPVNLEAFRELADEYGLWIIEDACHAPGGYFTDCSGEKQICGNGQFAELAIFSFHPVKHIACGEGGMITTNDKELYDRLLHLRTHGITKREDLVEHSHGGWYYDMMELGYNYRLTDIQCALGLSQLQRAKEGLHRRREIADRYEAAFSGTPVRTISPANGIGHAYHLFIVLLKNRKEVYDKLREQGIHTQVHYIPVHTLKYYADRGNWADRYPNAESYYSKCLSLPMYSTLTDEEQDFVIDNVLKYTSHG